MTDVKTVLGDREHVHLLFARTLASLVCFFVGICKGQINRYLKTVFKTLPDFPHQLKSIHFTIKQGNVTDTTWCDTSQGISLLRKYKMTRAPSLCWKNTLFGTEMKTL